MGSTPTCRAVRLQRTKITIESLYRDSAHAKGIEITGPNSTTVVEVFLAIFDALGAQALGAAQIAPAGPGPRPGPNEADLTQEAREQAAQLQSESDHEDTMG